jgi:hypothetical protein
MSLLFFSVFLNKALNDKNSLGVIYDISWYFTKKKGDLLISTSPPETKLIGNFVLTFFNSDHFILIKQHFHF